MVLQKLRKRERIINEKKNIEGALEFSITVGTFVLFNLYMYYYYQLQHNPDSVYSFLTSLFIWFLSFRNWFLRVQQRDGIPHCW